jgi:hypothetical protein
MCVCVCVCVCVYQTYWHYVYNNQLDANVTAKMTVSELTVILEVTFATYIHLTS